MEQAKIKHFKSFWVFRFNLFLEIRYFIIIFDPIPPAFLLLSTKQKICKDHQKLSSRRSVIAIILFSLRYDRPGTVPRSAEFETDTLNYCTIFLACSAFGGNAFLSQKLLLLVQKHEVFAQRFPN